MKGTMYVLFGGVMVLLVLAFSQMEVTFLASSTSHSSPNANAVLLNGADGEATNSKLKQRLIDLGQFLTQNSKASQDALDQADKRIKELEIELATVQSGHKERIAMLEERIGNLIPKVAPLSVGARPTTTTAVKPFTPTPLAANSNEEVVVKQIIQPQNTPTPPQPSNIKPPAATSPSASLTSIHSSSRVPPLEQYLIENNAINPKESAGASATRDEIIAYRTRVNQLTKQHKELLMQEEVDLTNAAAKARGLDFSIRRKVLPQQNTQHYTLSNTDIYNAPHREGGLKDMYVNHWSQIAVCTIEKVASSELKKLLYRMNGDPKWRDEPWFKGGLAKINQEKEVKKVESWMNTADWTKMIFLRHPFERLVSCYKDKFGRDNKLYSVKMTGNKSTEILSFETFVEMISAPGSPHQNQHWRPQHTFCGLKKFLPLFNFVGNFEHLEEHAKVFLTATDLWHNYGSNGWGEFNSSMFSRNEAAHRTGAGAVEGTLKIDKKKASMSYDKLLPPGSKLRRMAFEYYKKDFEMMASITTPPFDNTRYITDLATKGG